MANIIKQKRGTTDPVAGDLVVGELAINTTDGGVFTKTDGGTVVEVGSGGGGASAINDLSDAVTYDSGSSIGLGTGALVNDDGTNNKAVAVGFNALNSLTSGHNNVAVGWEAGKALTTALQNTLLGGRAGIALTTASHDVFVGYEAGLACTTGSSNVGIGRQALDVITTGQENVAIGWQSMSSTGTGVNSSVALGYRTLNNTTANRGTAVGFNALSIATSGAENTALGYQAGDNITTGANNIVIGANADASAADATNEITLGNTTITSFRIPGLQSGATNGQVLTYNSTNGNITLQDAGGGFTQAQATATTLIFG